MEQRIFDDAEVYTVKEIAERLKIHADTVRDWLRSGKLRGTAFGGRTGWRVKGKDLNTFIESRGKREYE